MRNSIAREFLRLLGCDRAPLDHLQLSLQERSEEGITDLELHAGHVHVVVEAKKRGWPQQSQMEQYEAKLLALKGCRVLCALGVPPVSVSPVRNWRPKAGVALRHVRWVRILELVRQTQKHDPCHDARQVLDDLGDLIQEMIDMQSYDREVLVRDMRWGTQSSKLFFDGNMYVCQASERAEPLFFAPCFTGAPTSVHNGIHYFSRVYYRTAFTLGDRAAAQQAIAEAAAAIKKKTDVIRKLKGASDELQYLGSLERKWKRGRSMLRGKSDEQAAVFFLGDAMPLPTPLYKKGFMIPKGFSISLERLLRGNLALFRV